MENQNKPMNFNDYNYIGKAEIEKNLQEVQDNTDQDLPISSAESPDIPQSNDKFMSITLPSGFMFYDFDNIKVRKFELRDLSKMHRVVKTGSDKLFKEVIQGCVNKDINLLTPGDFKYICYWLRLNSYPKSPMTIEWTSKYGNENITQVYKDNIKLFGPDITKEELQVWRSKGFEVPVLKFSDIFDEEGKEDSDDDFLISNAQYFKGDTWEEKIKNCENYINTNGLESLADVNTFDKLIYHGVEEEITVTDAKFDPQVYKKSLKERIQKLKLVISNIIDVESEEAAMFNLMLERLKEEYKSLDKKLKAGEVVQAEPETIFLEMEASVFLSPILSTVH